MKKLAVLFVSAALCIASAKTYRLTLFQPSVVSGTELKAGDYNLQVDGDKIVIRAGKVAAEATAKPEANGEKFRGTSIRYAVRDGRNHIVEIRLGGTNTKLVLN